ncbi:hypothetical protein PS947_04691 [Pseudomonas fluorescens]|nr:hypothetical protein PS947_04691 [Pseudomonas fluorescens]
MPENSFFVLEHETCGSEPARESGVSFTEVLTELAPSRAGSLPQLDQRRAAIASTDSRISAGPL